MSGWLVVLLLLFLLCCAAGLLYAVTMAVLGVWDWLESSPLGLLTERIRRWLNG